MDNYVLLYNFEESSNTDFFKKRISSEFLRHREEENNGFKYFGFAAGKEPGVVSKLQEIVHDIGIGTKDYIALYYSREDDPDKIKREMILGHDSLIETKVKDIFFDAHRNSLTKLLDFDYQQTQPHPSQKT